MRAMGVELPNSPKLVPVRSRGKPQAVWSPPSSPLLLSPETGRRDRENRPFDGAAAAADQRGDNPRRDR